MTLYSKTLGVAIVFFSTLATETIAQDPIFLPPRKPQTTHLIPPQRKTGNEQLNQKANLTSESKELAPTTAVLTPTVIKEIEAVLVPSARNQANGVFLHSLLTLASKLNDQKLNAVDRHAKLRGLDIKQRYVQLLSDAIQRGQQLAVPNLKLHAVKFFQSAIHEKLNLELEELEQFTPMKEPLQLPQGWRDSEHTFRDIAQWHERMQVNAQLCQYSEALQRKILDFAKKQNDSLLIRQLLPAKRISKKVTDRQQELVEREAELRIDELRRAVAFLNSGGDVTDQVYASMAILRHGPALNQLFEDTPSGEFVRPRLNQPDLPRTCVEIAKTAFEQHQAIINKSILLRDGLTWWLRGRYGAGKLADGLLKSKESTKSLASLRGLFMPRKSPVTVGKLDENNIAAPGFERRHFYTWAIESNGLMKNFAKAVSPNAEHEPQSNLDSDHFWSDIPFGEQTTKIIAAADVSRTYLKNIANKQLPNRLVGSLEYLNALGAFEQLQKSSTEAELAAYDHYLAKRPEFSFYNGANRQLEDRPDLTEANQLEKNQFDIKFKKEGLSWLMALARAELGATLSLHGKTKRPFEAVTNNEFDADAYVEVLTDDVAAHMKSLSLEPGFQKVTQRSHRADSWTLAYLKRIKLIKDMLQTLTTVGGPEVATKLEPYKDELNRYRDELVGQVQFELESAMMASIVPTGPGISSASSSITSGGLGSSLGSGLRSSLPSSIASPASSSTLNQCEGFIFDNFDITDLFGQ